MPTTYRHPLPRGYREKADGMLLRRLDRRSAGDRGVTTVEYGLIIAGVALVLIPAIVFLNRSLSSSFQSTTPQTGVCVGAGCNAQLTLPSAATPAAQAPAAPTVLTQSAVNVTSSAAVLTASVNANGSATTSISIRYSTLAATVSSGGGTSATVTPTSTSGYVAAGITAQISGLSASTTYYYRASATNGIGTTAGATLSFVTPSSLPSCSTLTLSNQTVAKGGSINVFTLGGVPNATLGTGGTFSSSNSSVTVTPSVNGSITWTWSGGSSKSTDIAFTYTATGCSGTGIGTVTMTSP